MKKTTKLNKIENSFAKLILNSVKIYWCCFNLTFKKILARFAAYGCLKGRDMHGLQIVYEFRDNTIPKGQVSLINCQKKCSKLSYMRHQKEKNIRKVYWDKDNTFFQKEKIIILYILLQFTNKFVQTYHSIQDKICTWAGKHMLFSAHWLAALMHPQLDKLFTRSITTRLI